MEISYIHVRRDHKKDSVTCTLHHLGQLLLFLLTLFLVCYHLDSCLSLPPQSGLQSASHHQTLSHYHSKVLPRQHIRMLLISLFYSDVA